MSAEKKKGSKPAAAEGTAESLDQVRDILFGAQMRTVDVRMGQIEERLQEQLEQLRQQFEDQLAGLDAQTRKASQALEEKLKSEQARSNDTTKTLRAEQRDAAKTLGKQLQDLERATGQADAELRDHLLSEAQRLGALLERLATDLRSEQGQSSGDLDRRKPDAAQLATMFHALARQLEGEVDSDA